MREWLAQGYTYIIYQELSCKIVCSINDEIVLFYQFLGILFTKKSIYGVKGYAWIYGGHLLFRTLHL